MHGSGTAPDTDEGDNFFHDYHPRVLILLLLKGTTFYYKMGQPSVNNKTGDEKLRRWRGKISSGDMHGFGNGHHSPMEGQLFLHFWNNLPFYFHPSLLLLKGTTFLLTTGDQKTGDEKLWRWRGKILFGGVYGCPFWTIIPMITADDIHPTFLMILDNQLMVSGVYGVRERHQWYSPELRDI